MGRGTNSSDITDVRYEATRTGRPKGVANRFTRSSVERLKELGFDPLEKLVGLFKEISDDIAEAKATGRGLSVAASNLRTSQKSVAETLMAYAYSKPKPDEDGNDKHDPIRIEVNFIGNKNTSVVTSSGSESGTVLLTRDITPSDGDSGAT